MQVGVGTSNNSNSAGSANNSNRSVGQRIKEASLKEFQLNNSSYNNNNSVHNATSTSTSTGLGANNGNSNGTVPLSGRTMRTAALCAVNSEFAGKQRRPAADAIILSDIQRNTIRVIGQYLRDLGMNDTVDSLVEESGCRIENSLALRLQDYVLVGAWSKALIILEKFKGSMSERQYLTIRVLLLEERFKTLIANNELLGALHLLQMDYPKEKYFKDRCEHLATTLMTLPILTSETCESDGFFAFDGGSSNFFDTTNGTLSAEPTGRAHQRANNESVLKTLQKMLPPTFLLPPKRLDELLTQSWKYQTKHCDLHVPSPNDENLDSKSILKNHQCCASEFPSKNVQVLHDHHAEVWCLEFSPSGLMLASGAKSGGVLIWQVDPATFQLSLLRCLPVPHEVSGIASISWSADSRYVAVASSDDTAGAVYVYCAQSGTLFLDYQPTAASSFSVVSFFADPQSHRMACGDQRGHFHVCDVDRSSINPKSIEGFRIRCIYSMKDGKTVLAADTHNRIRSYDFDTMQESTIIQETSQIIYFSVDKLERYCLITTKTEGIRLWSLKTKNLLRSFYGSMHHEFVISTSFGGFQDNFVVSGSEDENVVIWNIGKSEPVKYLTGHTGTVNAVSWNPVLHGMLVSGSDDSTIRVWAAMVRKPPKSV